MKKAILFLLAIAAASVFGAQKPPIIYSIYTTGTVAQVDAHVASAASIPAGVITNNQPQAVKLTGQFVGNVTYATNSGSAVSVANGVSNAWAAADLLVGAAATNHVTGVSNALAGQIVAGVSGVASVNGSAGAVSIVGAGYVTVGTTSGVVTVTGTGGGGTTTTNASELTTGTLALERLPSAVVTNFQSDLHLASSLYFSQSDLMLNGAGSSLAVMNGNTELPAPVTADSFLAYGDSGFIGAGNLLTNLNGENIQAGTINSNSFDVGTSNQLALVGGGSGTELTVGTNVFGIVSNYVAGVYTQTTNLIIKGSTNTIANGVYSQVYSNYTAEGEGLVEALWTNGNNCGIWHTDDTWDPVLIITNSSGQLLFQSVTGGWLPGFPPGVNLFAVGNGIDGTLGWTSNTVAEPYWEISGWQSDTNLYASKVIATHGFTGDLSLCSNAQPSDAISLSPTFYSSTAKIGAASFGGQVLFGYPWRTNSMMLTLSGGGITNGTDFTSTQIKHTTVNDDNWTEFFNPYHDTGTPNGHKSEMQITTSGGLAFTANYEPAAAAYSTYNARRRAWQWGIGNYGQPYIYRQMALIPNSNTNLFTSMFPEFWRCLVYTNVGAAVTAGSLEPNPSSATTLPGMMFRAYSTNGSGAWTWYDNLSSQIDATGNWQNQETATKRFEIIAGPSGGVNIKGTVVIDGNIIGNGTVLTNGASFPVVVPNTITSTNANSANTMLVLNGAQNGSTGNVIEYKTNNVSKFRVDSTGAMTIVGALGCGNIVAATITATSLFSSSGLGWGGFKVLSGSLMHSMLDGTWTLANNSIERPLTTSCITNWPTFTILANTNNPTLGLYKNFVVSGTITTTNGMLISSNSFVNVPTLYAGQNFYCSSNGVPHVIWSDEAGTLHTNRLVP